MQKAGLLVIDIQNDYLKDGAFPLTGAEEAAENAARLMQHFSDKGAPVYVIEHESVREGSTFFLPGTEGQKVADVIQKAPCNRTILKNFPNSFKETDLLEAMKKDGVEKLVVTGMMTFMCVDATIRAAVDLGFSCTLVHDATAARSLGFGDRQVASDDVQTAFIGALSFLCESVVSTNDIITD